MEIEVDGADKVCTGSPDKTVLEYGKLEIEAAASSTTTRR
jgi:hypothetical protein